MQTSELTAHLLSTSTKSYASATSHPFLLAAGNGSLNHELLALWLSQDRIYAAHAYPKFIGSLILNIPFSSSHALDSLEEQSNQRILKILLFSLENVVREAEFFKNTAKKYDLNLERRPERKGTRDYTAEMARISNTGNIVDGLVFLWAMEKVYLDAWSFVRDELRKVSTAEGTKSPTLAAIESLADNWSSLEFISFVDELAALVNSLKLRPGTDEWKRAENIWTRVLELEVEFWPVEGEAY